MGTMFPAVTPHSAAPSSAGTGSGKCPSGCHTCVKGDACWQAIDWAVHVGIQAHPQWYPGLDVKSNSEDIQAVLHGIGDADVPKPCRPCAGGNVLVARRI